MGNSCWDLAQLDWKIEENESLVIWVNGNWTKQISGKQNIERTILNWLEGKYSDWMQASISTLNSPAQQTAFTSINGDNWKISCPVNAGFPPCGSAQQEQLHPCTGAAAGPNFSDRGRAEALLVPPRDQALPLPPLAQAQQNPRGCSDPFHPTSKFSTKLVMPLTNNGNKIVFLNTFKQV